MPPHRGGGPHGRIRRAEDWPRRAARSPAGPALAAARRRATPARRRPASRRIRVTPALAGQAAHRPGPADAGESQRALRRGPVRRRELQRQSRFLQVGLAAAGREWGRRPGPLLPCDQPGVPHLRQGRQPCPRPASELHSLDGTRRLLRERQREHATRQIRHDGRPVARHPGRDRLQLRTRLDTPLRRRLDERGPDRNVQPVRLRPRSELSGDEPSYRYLARGLLRDGQPVQGFRRRGFRDLCVRPECDPRGGRGQLSVCRRRHDAPVHALGAALRSRRRHAAARGSAERLGRSRRGLSGRQPERPDPHLEFSRGLRRPRQFDVRGTGGRRDRSVCRPRLRDRDRRRLRPAARLRAAAPRQPEPVDVPPRVPELRRSRVARHQLHRGRLSRREPGGRAVVRGPRPQRNARDLPAGDLRSGRELPLRRLDRDGSQRERGARLQQVRCDDPPVTRRDGTTRRRPGRNDGRRGCVLRGLAKPAPGRRLLGRLQLDGGRSGGRLHVLVHGPVHRGVGAALRVHAGRIVQVRELHERTDGRHRGHGDGSRLGTGHRRRACDGRGLRDDDRRRRALSVPRAAGRDLRHDGHPVRFDPRLGFRCGSHRWRHDHAGLRVGARPPRSPERRGQGRLGRGLAALREDPDHRTARVLAGRALHRSGHRVLRDHAGRRRDVHAVDRGSRFGLRGGRSQPAARDGGRATRLRASSRSSS